MTRVSAALKACECVSEWCEESVRGVGKWVSKVC